MSNVLTGVSVKSDIIFEKNLETNQLNVSINTERLIMKSTISSHLSDYKKLLMNPENMLKVNPKNKSIEIKTSLNTFRTIAFVPGLYSMVYRLWTMVWSDESHRNPQAFPRHPTAYLFQPRGRGACLHPRPR